MQFLMTKDGYVGMQFLMTMDECVEAEAGSRKQEVAGHTTTRVRKQRAVQAWVQLTLFFSFGSGVKPIEWCCLHSGLVLPLS